MKSVRELLALIPEGYSLSVFRGETYGVTKTTFNSGKSAKLYAKSLSGTDFISLNFYQLTSKGVLKPCEMPRAKVVDFLQEHRPVGGDSEPQVKTVIGTPGSGLDGSR